MSLPNFSTSEVKSHYKGNYIDYLEDNIKEQRHEVASLCLQIHMKRKITKEDISNILDDLQLQISDLLHFNKFAKCHFECFLLSGKTTKELENLVKFCKEINKVLKKKK